jgi:hypothetical protein
MSNTWGRKPKGLSVIDNIEIKVAKCDICAK